MKRSKKNELRRGYGSMFWITWGIVLVLTIFRLMVAISGAPGESEALIALCATHPAGGYIEGPAGTPLLVTLVHFFFASPFVVLRWISPLAALVLSWCVWWVAQRIAPRRPSIALWSVLGVNLLPAINLASLVMDGALVTSAWIFLSLVTGWHAVQSKGGKLVRSWALFGAVLGVSTFFFYPVGFLLPAGVIAYLSLQGAKSFPWKAVLIALGFLAVGWIVPLVWNARHDWIQWSSVAAGFDCYRFGGISFSLIVGILLSMVLVPPLVLFTSSTTSIFWRGTLLLIVFIMAATSAVILLMPQEVSSVFPGLPSPIGVQGVGNLAREVIALRKECLDAKGEKSFLIAATPGLAALLGERIPSDTPECPGAPSVFVADAPSLNSSFALWPSYADAVAASVKDIFYTEEKWVSPFLGRNAFYITTEAPSELPQTITGAFEAVGLLKEQSLLWNGHPVMMRIYQCEHYRSLAL